MALEEGRSINPRRSKASALGLLLNRRQGVSTFASQTFDFGPLEIRGHLECRPAFTRDKPIVLGFPQGIGCLAKFAGGTFGLSCELLPCNRGSGNRRDWYRPGHGSIRLGYGGLRHNGRSFSRYSAECPVIGNISAAAGHAAENFDALINGRMGAEQA